MRTCIHTCVHTHVQEYFCPFTIGSSLLVLLRYIIHHSAVRELSSRAERAFCLARHSSSRSNARGPLWITPTNVPLSLFFFLSLLLFHSLRSGGRGNGLDIGGAHEFLCEITYLRRSVYTVEFQQQGK